MKNNILQLHNQSERTVEKIDCPFSMPMSRKERPPMTKPREKTREELQAEIEGGKKKIRQFENREKMLRQKLFKEERRTRSHRLIVRGAVFESIVPEAKGMTNEESATFLLLLCHVYFSFFQALNSKFLFPNNYKYSLEIASTPYISINASPINIFSSKCTIYIS